VSIRGSRQRLSNIALQGPERVVVAIESGGLLDVLAHPNQAKYLRQRILVVAADNYVYLVPVVEEEE
jgi:hypothetical protein